MAPDLIGVVLAEETAVIAPQADIANKTDETILLVGDQVLTMYEANGLLPNPNPVAHIFGADLAEKGTMPFPRMEYLQPFWQSPLQKVDCLYGHCKSLQCNNTMQLLPHHNSFYPEPIKTSYGAFERSRLGAGWKGNIGCANKGTARFIFDDLSSVKYDCKKYV